MALLIADKLKPKNNGSFALIDAADVEMPDGSRLSDLNFSLNSKVSWNDLTDKPFHAGDVLYVWNEETEYETPVTEGIPESAPYTSLVKISDDAPESDSLIGKIMFIRYADGTQQEDAISKYWFDSNDGWYMVGNCLIVVTAESSTADGLTLTKGVWMPDGFNTAFEYALSEVKISDPIVQIDEQFIPDTIARVSDIPEQIVPPVTSVNGQTGDVVIETNVSWNDLTDKPFGAEKVYYEWNEDAEYENAIENNVGNDIATRFVKVSDDAPDRGYFIGKSCEIHATINGEEKLLDLVLSEEHLLVWVDGMYMMSDIGYVVTAESITTDAGTFTRGIWALSGFKDPDTFKISDWKIYDPIAQLDEQFIPDTIARVSDIPEQITPPVTSVNGQTGDVVIETNVSWNDLSDRPFGAEKVYYEWNDDIEYETVVTEGVPENSGITGYVKLSDEVIDSDFFIGKNIFLRSVDGRYMQEVIDESYIASNDGWYIISACLLVVTADYSTSSGITLTKGVWMPDGFDPSFEGAISEMKIYDPIAQLDEQFIPDTIARKSDLETITIDQVDPDKVIFPEGLTTTYAIGNVALENGMATLVEPGGTLTDFFNIFVDEKNPSTTQPSVSLTFSQAKAYEVGTEVTPSYSASLNPGSYTYGPATGVTATSWSVSDSDGNTSEEASGSFPKFTVGDDTSYSITAKAQHSEGAIPLTNTKNEYPAGKIASGEKSTTSSKVTGFRKTFYGTTTDKAALSSDAIRGLSGKSSSALANGSTFTVTIPVGAMRVVIAYPATLRDVSSIKDVNGLNAEIASGFTKSTLAVEGVSGYEAIDYKIYTLEYAEANDKANTYTVKI